MRNALLAFLTLAPACSFSGATGSATNDAGPVQGDAGAADFDAAPLPLGACGRPGAFRGAFRSSEWTQRRGQDVDIAASQIDLTPSSMAETVEVSSIKAVNLSDSAVEIKIARYPSGSEDIVGTFEISRGPDERLGMRFTSDLLQAVSVVGGTAVVLATVPLDPAAHRALRLREESDTVSLETSADGSSFTALAQLATPELARAAHISFSARRLSNSGSSNAHISLAELNAGVNPSKWCEADSLSDSFAGPLSIDWELGVIGSRCIGPSTSGGQARIDQGSGGDFTNCAISTSTGYQLDNDGVVVEIDAIGTFESSWLTFFEVVDDSGERVRLHFIDDEMCVAVLAGDGTPITSDFENCIAYLGNGHRYWRLRFDGTSLVAEVSGNGEDFSQVDSGAPPFPMSAVRLRFGTESTSLAGTIGLGVNAYNP